jgi:hypothetical protein
MTLVLRHLALGLAALLGVLITAENGRAGSQWLVTAYELGPTPQMSRAVAETWLGKAARFEEGSLEFLDKVCRYRPVPKEVDAASYFPATFNIKPETLGLAEPTVLALRSECDIPGFETLFSLPDGRLMLQREGVFFFLSLQTD